MNVSQLRRGDWFLYRGDPVTVLSATPNRHDRTVTVTYRFAQAAGGRIRTARFLDTDDVIVAYPEEDR